MERVAMSLNLDLLDALFDVRAQLTDLVVRVSPSNSDETACLTQLVQLRDRLNGAINRLIALNVSDATAGLEEALGKVRSANDDMTSVTKDIAGVKTAISIVGQVLTVAATVVSALAAL
jgi:hypothetical protein